MSKSKRKKIPPKRVLALPHLEQSMSAVLNTLTSKSGQRTYEHAVDEFVDWYFSEPRLALNRTVVLRYESIWNRSCTLPPPSTFFSLQCGALHTRPPIRAS